MPVTARVKEEQNQAELDEFAVQIVVAAGGAVLGQLDDAMLHELRPRDLRHPAATELVECRVVGHMPVPSKLLQIGVRLLNELRWVSRVDAIFDFLRTVEPVPDQHYRGTGHGYEPLAAWRRCRNGPQVLPVRFAWMLV
ncbi:MAG: hypothetical protein OXH86_14645 [Acidimicrobiaceae bacterium]|nr:hypothetical protein [Acidimicrobiaceae bacterium]